MSKLQQHFKKVFVGLAMAGLAACSIQHSNDKAVDKTVQKAQSIYNNNRVQTPKTLVTNSDNIFLTNNHFVITPEQKLPPVFDKHLVYSTGVSETLSQTFANIAKLTGVPVVFANDTHTQTASHTPNTAGVITYQGTLVDVVNQLVDRSGLFWTYKDGKINIFLLETKTYTLDAPIGSFNTNNSISSNSDTSGTSSSDGNTSTTSSSTGTSSMSLNYDVKADSPWTAAVTTLKDMLSPVGRLQGNPVEGYIAVTDTPSTQEKVAEYIHRINEKTNKKIAVRIDVYDVSTDASSQYAFDMNIFASIFSQDTTISTNPTGLFKSTTGLSELTFQAEQGSSHKAVLNALNQFGKASEVTGATIYTISGQPAPIQSVRQQSYLAAITVSATANTGTTQTSLSPGTVVTGYSMMVTPKIEANNQIMVALDLQLSTLLKMNAFCSNGSTDPSSTSTNANQSCIYAPDVSSKNFLENMVLHNGQSLLIAGFQDESTLSNVSSPTSPDYWLIGGGKETDKTKVTTVIVVTPYIIGD